MSDLASVIRALESASTPEAYAALAGRGIPDRRAVGVELGAVRRLALGIGTDHALAVALWAHGVHEGRLVAVHIASPISLSSATMNAWCADFDSWALCDTTCSQLFHRTPLAWSRSEAWTRDDRPLVRRAGYALAGAIALHVEHAGDAGFCTILDRIAATVLDEPPIVRNVVGSTLGRIGRRNEYLRRRAQATARLLVRSGSASSGWVGEHALAQLECVRVRERSARRPVPAELGPARPIRPAHR